MTESIRFVINERGEKIAVIISIEEYERILKKLDDLRGIRSCKEKPPKR
jgi:prevent-host-death family protein